MIKHMPGTVYPDEYNWKDQFSLEGIFEPYIMMDVGKVRGISIALEKAEHRIAELEEAYEAGRREGMERAAEIAEGRTMKEGNYLWISKVNEYLLYTVQAIRKEIENE